MSSTDDDFFLYDQNSPGEGIEITMYQDDPVGYDNEEETDIDDTTPFFSNHHQPPPLSSSSSSSSDLPSDKIKKKMGLSFRDIGYVVPSPSSSSSSCFSFPWSKKEEGGEKTILEGVGGMCPPGSFLAILGPSGAGKTSLLNILAQRKQHGVSGTLLYGGQEYSKEMKDYIAYCVQDDILIPSLTVRETLMFSLKFRLNQMGLKWTKEEREERIDSLLSDLLLHKVADSTVGSVERKGISGGEKRRLSIGCELVLLPSLLFLDEPTTGLDSYSALTVMKMVKGLCAKGVSVVCTIHQPRSNIFKMFDLLLLLAEGKVMYFGLASEMVQYFSDLGYSCPLYINPADFIFDTLHSEGGGIEEEEGEERVSKGVAERFGGLFERSKQFDLLQKMYGRDCFSSSFSALESFSCARSSSSSSISLSSSPSSPSLIPDFPSLSSFGDSTTSMDSFPPDPPTTTASFSSPPIVPSSFSSPSPSLLKAQLTLLHRSWLTYSRNRSVVLARGFAAFFAGLLIGLIFFNQSDDPDNLVAACCFLLCAFGLFCLPTVSVYVENRLVFQRDYQRGYYSAFTFGLSNQIVEFPILVSQVLIYGLISYWMVGFYATFGHFITFLLIVFLETEVCFGVCQIFSLICRTINSAIAGYISFFLFCLAMGGFIIPKSSIPDWMNGLMYATPFWYGFAAILENEFEDYDGGDKVLAGYEVTDMSLWLSIGILAQYYLIVQLAQAILLDFLTRRAQ